MAEYLLCHQEYWSPQRIVTRIVSSWCTSFVKRDRTRVADRKPNSRGSQDFYLQQGCQLHRVIGGGPCAFSRRCCKQCRSNPLSSRRTSVFPCGPAGPKSASRDGQSPPEPCKALGASSLIHPYHWTPGCTSLRGGPRSVATPGSPADVVDCSQTPQGQCATLFIEQGLVRIVRC